MGLELIEQARAQGLHRYVHDLINDGKEKARRHDACERVKLYRDDYHELVDHTLRTVFREPAVFLRMQPLVGLIGSASFLRRVADELGRPLYARPPLRRVVLPNDADATEAQAAYSEFCAEVELDAKQDTTARLLSATGAMFQFLRYVEGLGRFVLDVMTPDMISVVPHPEVPTLPLAFAYAKTWHDDKPFEFVVWDDKRYFEVGPQGGKRPERPHDFGVLPLVDIHLRGRTCHYWQPTVNRVLVSQSKQSLFFDAIVVKKVRSQSHRQMTWTGSPDGLTKDQVSDEESILVGQNGSWGEINLESDPLKIIETKQANEAATAATFGISRDRMNQRGSTGDDAALFERVAEIAAVMVPAEVRLFELYKVMSREHPRYRGRVPDDARLVVDLGQLFNRVDRKTQLEIRQMERSMGQRSVVDDVLEDNPEFGGSRDLAELYVDEKMKEEARYIEKRRALNISGDATAGEPGQSAARNGAMGPSVRDGHMTRDEAAEMAHKGADPKMVALARRVLSA